MSICGYLYNPSTRRVVHGFPFLLLLEHTLGKSNFSNVFFVCLFVHLTASLRDAWDDGYVNWFCLVLVSKVRSYIDATQKNHYWCQNTDFTCLQTPYFYFYFNLWNNWMQLLWRITASTTTSHDSWWGCMSSPTSLTPHDGGAHPWQCPNAGYALRHSPRGAFTHSDWEKAFSTVWPGVCWLSRFEDKTERNSSAGFRESILLIQMWLVEGCLTSMGEQWLISVGTWDWRWTSVASSYWIFRASRGWVQRGPHQMASQEHLGQLKKVTHLHPENCPQINLIQGFSSMHRVVVSVDEMFLFFKIFLMIESDVIPLQST